MGAIWNVAEAQSTLATPRRVVTIIPEETGTACKPSILLLLPNPSYIYYLGEEHKCMIAILCDLQEINMDQRAILTFFCRCSVTEGFVV